MEHNKNKFIRTAIAISACMFLLCACTLTVSAENFIVDGTEWKSEYYPKPWDPEPDPIPESAKATGEFEFDGKTYVAIEYTYKNFEPKIICGLREEDGKVYWIDTENPENGEYLFYNFNLHPGYGCWLTYLDYNPYEGKWNIGEEWFAYCSGNSTITSCGTKWEALNMQCFRVSESGWVRSSPEFVWINGIGNEWGLLTNMMDDAVGGLIPSLIEVTSNGETVYLGERLGIKPVKGNNENKDIKFLINGLRSQGTPGAITIDSNGHKTISN